MPLSCGSTDRTRGSERGKDKVAIEGGFEGKSEAH